MDFPHDQGLNRSAEEQTPRTECMHPTSILPLPKHIEQSTVPFDPYYFYQDESRTVDKAPPPTGYLHAPLFWFRPVLDDNCAICIPTPRTSLHAYVTPLFELHSARNSIRL